MQCGAACACPDIRFGGTVDVSCSVDWRDVQSDCTLCRILLHFRTRATREGPVAVNDVVRA